MQAAPEQAPEEHAEWVVRGGGAGGCQVVAEADPRPGAPAGRLSFSGRSATEQARLQRKADSSWAI